MSINNISNASFLLQKHNECAYELKIQFTNADEKAISDKSFTFKQQTLALQAGEILDVYSQNGICHQEILGHLFENRDVKEIRSAVKKLAPPLTPSGPLFFVLDLKGETEGYFDPQIAKCEQVVCDFFKNITSHKASTRAKKVRSLFEQAAPLNFVLCEGSLKSKLLKEFSDPEIAFFQSKLGAHSFCQCAEYFMNGFKLGQEVGGISASNFITPVSEKFAAFYPYEKSTVWYPPSYKDLYSLDGTYAQTLKPVFFLSGNFDALDGITTMSVEVKR